MVHEVPDQQKFIEEIEVFTESYGRILIVEPIIHVTRRSFNELIKKVESAGLQIIARPGIAFSRSLLLGEKPGDN